MTGSKVSNVHSPVKTLFCQRQRRFFTDMQPLVIHEQAIGSASRRGASRPGRNSLRTTTNPSRS